MILNYYVPNWKMLFFKCYFRLFSFSVILKQNKFSGSLMKNSETVCFASLIMKNICVSPSHCSFSAKTISCVSISLRSCNLSNFIKFLKSFKCYLIIFDWLIEKVLSASYKNLSFYFHS